MKNTIFKAFILLCIILFTGCNQRVSVELNLNGEVIAHCDDAYITDLFPKDGGYRFNCEPDSSIYVIYNTKDPDLKGTITDIWMHTYKPKENERTTESTLYCAYYVNKSDDIDCPEAEALNKTTGEPPFDENIFGRLKKGDYKIMLSRPCGELIFKIGSPK